MPKCPMCGAPLQWGGRVSGADLLGQYVRTVLICEKCGLELIGEHQIREQNTTDRGREV